MCMDLTCIRKLTDTKLSSASIRMQLAINVQRLFSRERQHVYSAAYV